MPRLRRQDINAPLMEKMKGFSIKLTRIVVEDFGNKNEKHADGKTTRSKSSVEFESVAVASTSQQVKRRGRPVTKKIDETNSNELQPNATASTSQPAKRRRQQPAKSNVEAQKRSLRSNSSIDEISFETPERRTKRKKRAERLNELQEIVSESSDDEQMVDGAKNYTNVTVRHRKNDSCSTDGDVSKSVFDNESIELTHSDASETGPVTSKLAHSTLLHGKVPLTNLIESDNEMTPLLSEKLRPPEQESEMSSPERENLLVQQLSTVQQTIMDHSMEETPRNVTKTKEIRRETAESADDERSEDQAAQKHENHQSFESIFDTPEDMESDNVETDAVANTSSMIDTDQNVDETSAISVEENNNIKLPSKQTADITQSTTVYQERYEVEEIVVTTSQVSTATPKNVLNELKDVLENRNARKEADEAVDAENGLMAHEMDHDASHNKAADMDMMNTSEDEHDLREPAPSTLAFQNSPPKIPNNRGMPAAPTPNTVIEKPLINIGIGVTSDDEEPGPSTSAFEAPPPKPRNKRKLPPVDVNQENMPGQFVLAKIPNYTRNGFLEETFFEPPTNVLYVFNARPDEVHIAVDLSHPNKRQRTIEIEPDEVITIKKRSKKRTIKRRASD